MVRNLAAVVSNYRDAGTSVFVAAYFVTGNHELLGIREAIGVQLRVVRLSVPLPDNERRLAADVTTERKEELREAARQITTGEGTERLIWVGNKRPAQAMCRALKTDISLRASPARHEPRHSAGSAGSSER